MDFIRRPATSRMLYGVTNINAAAVFISILRGFGFTIWHESAAPYKI
nr:hypothetical protein [uncultured Campylobacter sp.]